MQIGADMCADCCKSQEKTISERNASGKSVARTAAEGGLPYQLLMPSGVNDPKTGAHTHLAPFRSIPLHRYIPCALDAASNCCWVLRRTSSWHLASTLALVKGLLSGALLLTAGSEFADLKRRTLFCYRQACGQQAGPRHPVQRQHLRWREDNLWELTKGAPV